MPHAITLLELDTHAVGLKRPALHTGALDDLGTATPRRIQNPGVQRLARHHPAMRRQVVDLRHRVRDQVPAVEVERGFTHHVALAVARQRGDAQHVQFAQGSRPDKIAADLVARKDLRIDQQRVHAGRRQVRGGRSTGRAGADDQDLAIRLGRQGEMKHGGAV